MEESAITNPLREREREREGERRGGGQGRRGKRKERNFRPGRREFLAGIVETATFGSGQTVPHLVPSYEGR